MADPAPKARWYHPTPDRLVLALLAVECLLWLSERFQWLPFNRHKGWTVLIAVAAVGAAFLLMLLWFLAAVLFRRRFQFGIRSLLVLTVAVALPCSWLSWEMKKAREQKAAVAAIEQSGLIGHDYEVDPSGNYLPGSCPPTPAWLQDLLGEDFFASVSYLNLINTQPTDAQMEDLKKFDQLHFLYGFCAKLSDPQMENLRGLAQLQTLDIAATKVTDAGLKPLTTLTQLQTLNLEAIDLTDEGLKNVEGLSKLQNLYLDETKVTDAGLRILRG